MRNEYGSCSSCGNATCTFAIPGILIALFSAVIGLIIGAVVSRVVLASIAAFIVLAVVLAVLIGIWGIVRFCRCRRM